MQQLEEIVRVHKLALENLVGQQIPIGHPCMAWLVRHAADVVNRYLVMKDGTTSYERIKGRKFTDVMRVFAHPVLHRVSGKVQGGVVSERWHEGMFVGKHFESGEDLVSMADGLVVRARSVEERPTNVPVTMELLNTITGAPWQPTSTLCDAQPLDVRTPDGQQEANPQVEEVPEKAPARVYIPKTVLQKVGYSNRCKKCAAM